MQNRFWRYLPLDPPTPASVTAFLDRRLADRWGDGGYQCAIELTDAQHLIGTVRIAIDDPAHRSGDIGYALNGASSGRGYRTEAVSRILQLCFEELDLHRLSATTDVENDASWRVMERLGMQREGRLRHHRQVRGTWRDSYLHAILKSDR
ncbi:MAG: GNAT family protein [Pseudomonadota bacterium]